MTRGSGRLVRRLFQESREINFSAALVYSPCSMGGLPPLFFLRDDPNVSDALLHRHPSGMFPGCTAIVWIVRRVSGGSLTASDIEDRWEC